MNTQELTDYLDEHTKIVSFLSDYYLSDEERKNKARSKKQRKDETYIDRQVRTRLKDTISQMHEQLRPLVNESRWDPRKSWLEWLTADENLEQLEASILEADFD